MITYFSRKKQKKAKFFYWQIYFYAESFTEKQIHFVLAIYVHCNSLCKGTPKNSGTD